MAASDYLILFGDLVGSTEVASEASPMIFSRLYIASFHLAAECAIYYIEHPIFETVKFLKTIDGIKLAGDEVSTFSNLSGLQKDQKIDLNASAVAFAFVIKIFWIASPYNIMRLSEKKFPRDIALGIHIGPAEKIDEKTDSDIAGLHINVTKRLEVAARSGRHSRIFASDDVTYLFKIWLDGYKDLEVKKTPPLLYTRFKHVQSPLDLKGIPVKIAPFELQINEQDEEKIQNLFELIYQTPGHSDAEAEDAVKILGDTLIEKLFGKQSFRNYLGGIDTAEKYIEHWFKAVDSLPHLFLNDLWTVMMVFFLSCGFIRNNQLNQEKIKIYHDILSFA